MAKKASKKEAPKKSAKTTTKKVVKSAPKAVSKPAKKAPATKAVKTEAVKSEKKVTAKVKASSKAAPVEKATLATKATKQTTPLKKAKQTPVKSTTVKPNEDIESTLSPKIRTFKEALAQPLTVETEKKLEVADAEQKEETDRITPEDLAKKPAKKYQGSSDEESKWLELKDKYKWLKPQVYKMTDSYKDRTVLDHKVLGIGFILSVVNDRLEVLFQTGTKQLISNYKK